MFLIILDIPKKILLGIAELIGDRITFFSGPKNGAWWAVNDFPVLDVQASHLREIARVRAIVGQKLGYNCHRLESVDSVLVSPAVKVFNAHAIRIDIAAIFVTHAVVAIAAQHAPYFPAPILFALSFELGVQSITLASPS